MKKIILILTLGLMHNIVFSQYETDNLEGNNINAYISNNGVFFNDFDEANAGYEYPKASANHLIYSSSFWFGAKNNFGEIKMAAEKDGTNHDLFAGALTNDGSAEALTPAFADEVYTLSKADIDYHREHFTDGGYVMLADIENWPAHGDPSLIMDYSLAPFVDVNGNLAYEPELGDYPKIRGDYASYLIMNDKADIHANSGGDPLGIEVHFMFYQYDSELDYVDNTTFINVKVINRSTVNYPEFIVANFMDADIGFASDDFVGSNIENNVVFTYNGNLTDTGGGSGASYGSDVPAVGITALNTPTAVAGYFNNGSGVYGSPFSVNDYWNYMHAIWKNGIPFQFGGNGNTTGSGIATNYLFSGDTTFLGELVSWTELEEGLIPGDRRMFLATEATTLDAGEVKCFDFAVIIGQSGDEIYDAPTNLINSVADVKAFYESEPENYCDFTLGISELPIKNKIIQVYPNPSTGNFIVDLDGEYDLEIYAMDGRSIFKIDNKESYSIIETDLASGTYLLVITQNKMKYQSKLVID